MKESFELKVLTHLFESYGIKHTGIIEKLKDLMTPIKITKRTTIFKQGDKLEHLYFLPAGIVRYFVQSSDGKEITKSLRIGPAFMSSTFSMAKNERAPFSAEALHELIVYSLEINKWYQLVNENIEFAKFYIAILEDNFIEKERHELSLLQDSAETRYHHFQSKYSAYLNVIPQWMIATCLGITPEALSRLKKRI